MNSICADECWIMYQNLVPENMFACCGSSVVEHEIAVNADISGSCVRLAVAAEKSLAPNFLLLSLHLC